jgi:hypothetical protein
MLSLKSRLVCTLLNKPNLSEVDFIDIYEYFDEITEV